MLDVSTDVTALAVVDDAGDVIASAPRSAGAAVGQAAAELWDAATRTADPAGLEHVVVPVPDGVVALVRAHGRRALAVTGPRPAVALLLFDLRTCLDDAFAAPEETA